MELKVIAVDFDGTLVTDKWPEIGEPIWSTIKLIRHMKVMGNKIILWTCRGGKELEAAIDFCKNVLKIEFDAINENLPERIALYGGDNRKISADWYIDDRAWNPEN